jgi:transcription elongation GreA/GreB family factor
MPGRSDHDRIYGLLHHRDVLSSELPSDERADASLDADRGIPRDVVTRHSKITFVDLDTHVNFDPKKVYTHVAGSQDSVSALAAVATAGIGLRPGESVPWPLPHGPLRRLKVIAQELP